MSKVNMCVCCGEIIPEGRQVCFRCETKNAGEAIARGMIEGITKKDSPVDTGTLKHPFDIHKIIDDAMAKRDRTVSIYIGESGVSVSVYPVDYDKVKWIETERGMICSNYGNCESAWDCPTYCSRCGELMHGVRREE